MAGRENGERVQGENRDERLRQSLKDMNNGKMKKRRMEALKESEE